jgi:hypothetical protein
MWRRWRLVWLMVLLLRGNEMRGKMLHHLEGAGPRRGLMVR